MRTFDKEYKLMAVGKQLSSYNQQVRLGTPLISRLK